MKKTSFLKSSLAIAFAALTLFSCSKDDDDITPNLPAGEADTELNITNVIPSSMGSNYAKNFNRYTKVTTPNGGAIHIVAQDKITNEQIVRCRSILEHFLRDFSGSAFGNNKTNIANKMAENNAILTLLNGQDDGSNPLEIEGQALFQNEIQVEGHTWYMNQDYSHRDAAYEEILHLVHDYGIGVDGANSHPGAAPQYQAEIRAAQQNGLTSNIWAIGAPASQVTEWANENSLSQEYLASVIDSYYGLWGAWTESTTNGMWGGYIGKAREDVESEDPMGFDVVSKFFHPYLTYNARIDSSLDGNFSLKFDETKPYTHHSRYLKDITLLGSNNTTVTLNQLDNNITGNSENRDGTNTLKKIEKLQFTDQTIDL